MRSPYQYPQPSRPVAMGVNGMVSSAHPLATTAGLRVLMDGGNAFDAAVATAAVLNVVEPYMSGMGGIGVGLAHVAAEGRVRALDFSGRAPRAARPDLYSEDAAETGILAAMVPGNVAGWLTLHETYGTLDRRRLFQPAIDYAENGFPFTYLNSAKTAESADRLGRFPSSAAIMLDGDGRVAPARRAPPHDAARRVLQGRRGGRQGRLLPRRPRAAHRRGQHGHGGHLLPGGLLDVRGALGRSDQRPLPRTRRLHRSAQLQRLPGAADPQAPRDVLARRAVVPAPGHPPRYDRGGQAVDDRPRALRGRPRPHRHPPGRPAVRELRRGAAQTHRHGERGIAALGEVHVRRPWGLAVPGRRVGPQRRHDHPLRRGRRRGQRRHDHADARRRLRLGRGHRRYGDLPEQHDVLLRPRSRRAPTRSARAGG